MKLPQPSVTQCNPRVVLLSVKKCSNETQGPHVFFFTLLVMLGNYEPTCIVTIKFNVFSKYFK